mgnify:CR=1 FL=1
MIQWGTGNVGARALRGILSHPQLELVGVHAHSADKVGKDAADLCGLGEKTGVIATNDIDALLALDATVPEHREILQLQGANAYLPAGSEDFAMIRKAAENANLLAEDDAN